MSFLEIVLYPFSILYDLATRVRNYLFDIGYKRSFRFETNVISVGNLTVGGTGKTPMIEYIVRLLQDEYQLATLSRGYGRRTRGFRIAGAEDSARTVGDEPYQFYNKFEKVTVTVGEQRAVAIPFILAERPDTKVILLDDAYQHRYVDPNVNILLTDYNRPFFNDSLLPAGRLREARKGAKRADVVVVTKCPTDLYKQGMDRYIQGIRVFNSEAEIFFSCIKYDHPKPVYNENTWQKNVVLFSGIAQDEKLKEYIGDHFNLLDSIKFADHHTYSDGDLMKIKSLFDAQSVDNKCILTTEKDMVKLIGDGIPDYFRSLPLFYLPIEFSFINDGKRFDEIILNSISTYSN